MSLSPDLPVCARRLGRNLSLLLASGAMSLLIACGGTASDPPSPTLMRQTNVTASTNPLVANYSITTSGPAASVMVQFGPTTSYGFQTSSQYTPAGGGTVTIQVAGMQQNTTYHMRSVLTTNGGTINDQDHTFQTGAIPAMWYPQFQVTTAPGQTPTPGVQLVSFSGEAFAVDTGGNIIWYYNYPASANGPNLVKLLPNGNMLMIIGTGLMSEIREIDLAGNTLRDLTLSTLSNKLKNAGYNLNLTSIDHDVLLLPNNHLLFITSDTRMYEDLIGYPGETTVQGNAVIDVDENNNPVWVWDAFDHLDVNRHPINQLFPDWTHANALYYLPDSGNFLISLRHQHWVLKIDYAAGNGSGDVLWHLGYQGDFTLQNSTSPADWFYAQHDANIASPNTSGDFQLAVFDNGDYRILDDNGDECVPDGQPACYSTSAMFDVNENDMTAQREWTWMRPYSLWGGSVQLLPNTNMFVDETSPADLGGNTSRVSEVTQQNNPTLVWQMMFNNHTAYRTLHEPSLYPGVQW